MSDKENKNAQQVLVLQDDDSSSEGPRRWTWSKYGHSIALFKWWVIGSTLLATVGGYLVVRFGINTSKETVSSHIGYNLPISMNGTSGTGTYLDGTAFSFTDIISASNITAVKEANTEFSGVNTTELIKSGISISRNTVGTSTTDVTYDGTYTITAKLSNFGSEEVARDFMQALAETTQNKAEIAVNRYSVLNVIPTTYTSLGFEEQVAYLSSQYSTIDGTYVSLQNTFGDVYVTSAGNTKVTDAKKAFEAQYKVGAGGTTFDQMSGLLKSKNYYNYSGDKTVAVTQLKTRAENDKNNLKENLKNAQVKQEALDKYTSSTTNWSGNSEAGAAFVALNKELESLNSAKKEIVTDLESIGYIVPSDVTLDNISTIALDSDPDSNGKIQRLQANDTVWDAGCTSFQNSITSAYESLINNDLEAINSAYRYSYLNYKNAINYYNSGIITVSGHVSGFLGAALGLLIGFIVSSLVVTTITIAKEEKAEAVASGAAPEAPKKEPTKKETVEEKKTK